MEVLALSILLSTVLGCATLWYLFGREEMALVFREELPETVELLEVEGSDTWDNLRGFNCNVGKVKLAGECYDSIKGEFLKATESGVFLRREHSSDVLFVQWIGISSVGFTPKSYINDKEGKAFRAIGDAVKKSSPGDVIVTPLGTRKSAWNVPDGVTFRNEKFDWSEVLAT